MDMEINTNNNEQNNLGVLRPLGFGHGVHSGYGYYSNHYRNPFSGGGFIVPFAGGLLGGLAVGALLGDNNSYGYGYGGYPYPYYGGYAYPSYYYGGYGYPYWRYS